MELIFLDESGSPFGNFKAYRHGYSRKLARALDGKGPFPPYPFFSVAAVAIPVAKYRIAERWFSGLKQGYLKASPADFGQEYEIKGTLLYNLLEGRQPREWSGRGRPRKYTKDQSRVWSRLSLSNLKSLERSVFDLMVRIRPTLWAVVVKQERVYSKHRGKAWNPLHSSLTYIQQRISQHVEANYGSQGLAVVVMDETSTLSTAAQYEQFIETRKKINETASWPVEFKESMVDVPLAGPSHLVEPLQLADFVAHAVQRHVKGKDPRNWFGRLEPYFARHWTTGSVKNAGLTIIQ